MANIHCQNMSGEHILIMLYGFDTLYFFVLLHHLLNNAMVMWCCHHMLNFKIPNCIYDVQIIMLFAWVQSFYCKQLYVTELYTHYVHVGVIHR